MAIKWKRLRVLRNPFYLESYMNIYSPDYHLLVIEKMGVPILLGIEREILEKLESEN